MALRAFDACATVIRQLPLSHVVAKGNPSMSRDPRADAFVQAYGALRAEMEKTIVGHREIIDGVLTAMFGGGHVLLEGVPGLGKTLLIKTLAGALDVSFSRIQFTPDLMPADILGTNVIV